MKKIKFKFIFGTRENTFFKFCIYFHLMYFITKIVYVIILFSAIIPLTKSRTRCCHKCCCRRCCCSCSHIRCAARCTQWYNATDTTTNANGRCITAIFGRTAKCRICSTTGSTVCHQSGTGCYTIYGTDSCTNATILWGCTMGHVSG